MSNASNGIPLWWLITVAVLVGGYNGLSLIGTNPTVQRIAKPVGLGGVLTWMERYPPWQSSSTKRWGRILAIAMVLVFLVLGIFRVW